MGGQESKPPPEHDAALAVFSPEEQIQIQIIFDQMCGVDHASAQKSTLVLASTGPTQASTGFDSTQLQAYTATLPQRLAYHLYAYMLNVIPAGGQRPVVVNYYSFVVALSHILKGTPSERTLLVGSLASGGVGDVTTTQLIRLIEDLMEAYGNTLRTQEDFKTWKLAEEQDTLIGFTNILLQGLTPSGGEVEGDTIYDEDTLGRWTSSCALLQHILDTVFHPCFSLATGASNDTKISLIPQAVGAPWNKFSTLLDLPSLVLLTNSLPAACRSPWRLLFSDSIHGQSFSSFIKYSLGRGPCVMVLQDEDGHVFGGFTGSDLALKPQFSGDETSFLFSLHPTMQIYTITGLNTNYLYLNKGQETMPNGLGMGGQFQYFGLWLDAEYGKGQSWAKPTCTTYGSPQLSANPDFTIRHLEVWGVGPDPSLIRKEDPVPEPPTLKLVDIMKKRTMVITAANRWRKHVQIKRGDYTEQKLRIFSFLHLSMDMDKPPTSILDKDAGAKALLDMVNRPQHSEGLREADPVAGSPGEKTL